MTLIDVNTCLIIIICVVATLLFWTALAIVMVFVDNGSERLKGAAVTRCCRLDQEESDE